MSGGKVGGVGDVIRDLPSAVAALGWRPTVLTPAYGALHRVDGAERSGSVTAEFRGENCEIDVWTVPGVDSAVRNIVFDHARFVPTEPGIIYHQDIDGGPFETDAEKFAFFSATCGAWICSLRTAPAVIHMHDWQTGALAALREFEPRLAKLKESRMVFTIHNLSYQGQRPFAVEDSSFEHWFPTLDYDRSRIADPKVTDCFNPLASCIRLSDRLNTVSRSYKEEILQPSDAALGFIGGEGLEEDLVAANSAGRLVGILNGCSYADEATQTPDWRALLQLSKTTLGTWSAAGGNRLYDLAIERVSALPRRRPAHVLTSVGRVVAQKMSLLLQRTTSGRTALAGILNSLGDDGVVLLLGSGEPRYEEQLAAIAEEQTNLIFFRGYSEALGNALYSLGDLFLMPSSFEPCGISQMIAMRNAQPCIVNAVGGLRDTVEDGYSGFVFHGDSPQQQATNFVKKTADALLLRSERPQDWATIRSNAKAARFEWRTSAEQYIEQLYEHH